MVTKPEREQGTEDGQKRDHADHLAGLRDVDYRTRTFSCVVCGADGALAITDPSTETGMADYRLDQRDDPTRHPNAVRRLTRPQPRTVSYAGGELPGRNLKGRR